jgi:sugar transferase EpsL
MFKRIVDFIVALVLLIILSPVLLIISVLVLIYHGRPVLFHQIRPGLHGKPFKMMKFRSMTNETDENGELLPNEKRLTSFGKKLRSTSLDELPELINVIKGDMSLVGPRPLLMEYVSLYSPRQARRMDVKPGITGWAQINGRNAISWPKKFELDVWYVENQSFWLDLKILFITAKKVIIREGISHEGDVTMPRFKGEE